MDAFFAAVEQNADPSLRGKPVIIGADPKGGKGRGVVSTCSYEARKFGVHSAMPISEAWRKCPHGVFILPDGEKYSKASKQVYSVFYEFTPSVEAVGIDEAFLDLSGLEKLFGPPEEICFKIKARIKELTGLTASVGLAPNKMTAKIASDLQKPDGFVHVTPENLREFLFPLDIGKIWGMGEHSKQILNRAGIFTVGQLAAKKPSTLERLLGKNGLYLLELANGIDPRPVQAYEGVKSVSNEHTFTEDTSDTDKIRATLSFLAERVSARMRRKQLKGVTVGLKIRFDDFTTLTRARTIETPTNFPETILAEITKLFSQFVPLPRPVRLVGVRVANFRGEGKQLPLFEDADAAKKEKVYKAVDEIRKKYGFGSMGRASSSKDSDTE